MRRAAMDLLARREHAAAELRRKLHAKGHEEAMVTRVLADLTAEKLLDDARFVEAYVRSRAERGFGPRRIRAELREKGVDSAVIEVWLDERNNGWAERAADARVKRFGSGLPGQVREQARQMRFLEYRGFTGEHIRRALKADEWD